MLKVAYFIIIIIIIIIIFLSLRSLKKYVLFVLSSLTRPITIYYAVALFLCSWIAELFYHSIAQALNLSAFGRAE